MISRLLPIVLALSPLTGAAAQSPTGGADFGAHLVTNGADGYAWMAANAALRAAGTIEFWLKPTIANTGQVWSGGVGKPGANGDWVMFGTHASSSGFGWAVYAGLWRWSSGPYLSPGAWVHVAGTWSPTGCKVYVNGEVVGSNSYSGGTPAYAMELVGASAWGITTAVEVDDLRVWDHARSAAQIQSLMYSPLPASIYGDAGSGLLAYYPFDQFEDLGVSADGVDDLRDLAPGGNHADAEGGVTLEFGIVPTETRSLSELKAAYQR